MLDTNTCINFINRSPGYENIARRMSGRSPSELRLSAITVCELEFGIRKSQKKAETDLAIRRFLACAEVEDFPAGAARDYADIRIALKSQQIGAHDLLIAAHALSIGATVVTNHMAEFSRVPGLRTVDWMLP